MSQPAVPDSASSELSTDILSIARPIDNDQLRTVTDFNSAMELLENMGVPLVDSSEELGTGFKKTDNKKQFVGVPLVVLFWTFHDGDFGEDPFVAIHLVTRDGGKYILTDGSTGIRDELRKWTENNNGRTFGMICETGFSESEYKYCEGCQTTNTKKSTKCRSCGSPKLTKALTYYMH
jgi:hypothetical protein